MDFTQKSLLDDFSFLKDQVQAKQDVKEEKKEERERIQEEKSHLENYKYLKEKENAMKREANLSKQKYMREDILNKGVPIKALYGHGSKNIPIDLKYTNNDTGINIVTTAKWGSSQLMYHSLFLSYGLMASEIQNNLKRAVVELIDKSILEYLWLGESFFRLITQEFNETFSSEPMNVLAIKDFLNNNLIAQTIFTVSDRYLEELNRKCSNTISMKEIKDIEKDMIQILGTYLIDKKKDNGFLRVELKNFVRKHINLIKEILCFQIRIYRGYQTNNIPSIDINFDAVNLCKNKIVKRNKKFRDGYRRNGKFLNLPSGIIDPNIDTWELLDSPCTLESTLQYSEFPKRNHNLKYKLDEFIYDYNQTINNQTQIIVAFICGTINESDNIQHPISALRQSSDNKQAGYIYKKYDIINNSIAINNSNSYQSDYDKNRNYKNKYFKYKKKYLKLKQKLI